MPDLSFENQLRKEGYRLVAGIDEAGRGPLAGPVMAAAAVVPVDYAHSVLNGSKKLTERAREEIYQELIEDQRVVFASAAVEPDEIDRINILQATYLAMARAFEKLVPKADIALIDGKPVKNFPGIHKAVVKGDSL